MIVTKIYLHKNYLIVYSILTDTLYKHSSLIYNTTFMTKQVYYCLVNIVCITHFKDFNLSDDHLHMQIFHCNS